MDFERELKERTAYAEEVIKQYLPKEEGLQASLLKAMNYSVLAGGKRLRPILMSECYRMFGGAGKLIEPFMAAQEMIHTYSLVHDDLPAMDNDYYRRGKKTTHAVYGEAMAVLAGDGLLNYAFETACRAFGMEEEGSSLKETSERAAKAMNVLAKKAGIYGMIGGQAVDVEAEKQNLELNEEKLLFIHEHKTAALIQSSMMIGAVLAGAEGKDTALLEKAGCNIGIAFQIQDDILDITSTLEELGKPVGSDEKNGKLTYVSVHGLEKSKTDVEKLSKEALEILRGMPKRNEFLEELVLRLITRKK